MRAFSEPIERVLDHVRLLLGMPEVRALHIRTSTQLLPAMVGAVAASESKGENAAPMMVLVTPALRPGGGWDERTAELLREHRDLAATAGEADLRIDALEPPPARGVAGFAQALASAVSSLGAPLSGLVVILAPGEGSSALAGDLRALWSQSALGAVKWIVLESTGHLRGPVEELREHGLCVDAAPSAAELASELGRMAESVAAAPPGATGPAAAGCAGPGVAPPRRPHEGPGTPTDLLKEVSRAQGASAAHADPDIQKVVRAAVLRAMAASAAQDLVTAVSQFRAARDACLGAGLDRDAVTYEVMMASLALSRAPAEALQLFGSARDRAQSLGDAQLVVRTELGRAGALVVLGRTFDAVEAYRVAAEHAAPVEPVLAIEAYRMAGQLLAGLRQEQAAVASWRRALDLAERSDAATRAASTAPEVARALATVCERHGLQAQAASLRAQATALESPPDVDSLHPGRTLGAASSDGAA